MRALLLTLLTATFLSGCIFEDQPLEAHATLAAANGHAEDRLPGGFFAGMFGIEGDLDLAQLEEELEAAESEFEGIDGAFDFRIPQGTVGDGLPGSWFSVHLELGGWFFQSLLVTQVGTDGVLGSYLWQEDSEEYTTEAQTGFELPLRLLPQMTASTEVEAAAVTSHTEDWNIRSGRAAAIAADVPEFQEHVINEPQAEWVYVYLPAFVEDGEEVEDFGNQWVVVHTDLDTWMAGEEASAVFVMIDAATGQVQEVETQVPVKTLELIDDTYNFQGELLPSLVTGDDPSLDVPFEVTSDMESIWVAAYGDMEIALRDPNGSVRQTSSAGRLMNWFEAPAVGTWALTATSQSVTPNQAFSFDVHVTAQVPA